MPHASTIGICVYCDKPHITSIEGDPSPELLDLLERTHLQTRQIPDELRKMCLEEDCLLSHGLCETAAREQYKKYNLGDYDKDPGPNSGINIQNVRQALIMRSAMGEQVDQSQEGASKFHQKVLELIEAGTDRNELARLLGRIRDSYPSGDHHRDMAQTEINWINGLPQDPFSAEPGSLN